MSDPPFTPPKLKDIEYFVVKGSRLDRDGLIQYASILANDGKPLPQDTVITDAETGVITAIRDDVQRMANGTSDQLRGIVKEFTSTRDKIPTAAAMEDIQGDNLNAAVRQLLNAARERLDSAYRSQQKALRNLLFFKAKAKLDRDAHAGHSQLFHFGVILSLIVVESFLNLWFFAQGSDQGMLGGFFEALFVSLINVGTAVAMGQLVLPHMNVEKRRPLIIGIVVLYVLIVLVLNLTVAHYRDLMASGVEDAVRASVSALWRNPFELSFHSLLLFVVGLLAAGLGLREGYHAEDPYPGFSRVSQAHDDALAEYEAVKAECRTRAADLAKGVVPAMQAEIEKGRELTTQMRELLRTGMAAVEAYIAARAYREGECNQTLKAFRDANRAGRGAIPVPAYFAVYEDFSRLAASATNWSELPAWLEEAEGHLQAARARAAELANMDEARHEHVAKLCDDYFKLVEDKVNLQDAGATGVRTSTPKSA